MQIPGNKRNFLHEKRVQSPQDYFGTPTWPPLIFVSTNCLFLHDVMAAIFVSQDNETATMFVPNHSCGSWTLFLCKRFSFVPINLHRCWPRKWKHRIRLPWRHVKTIHRFTGAHALIEFQVYRGLGERAIISFINRRERAWLGHTLRHGDLVPLVIEGRIIGKRTPGRSRA